jgi:hypothetical protein
MTNPAFTGYLEDPYLEDPPSYLGGTATDHFGIQVNRIIDFTKANALQVSRTITSQKANGLQVQRIIDDDQSQGIQVNRQTALIPAKGLQVDRQIGDVMDIGIQVQCVITSDQDKGIQVNRIIGATKENGLQIERSIILFPAAFGFEIRRDKSFPHLLCPELGYLSEPYLGGPYLAEGYCVPGPLQVSRTITSQKANGLQIDRTIKDDNGVGTQIQRIIKTTTAYGFQIDRIRASAFGIQIRRVLYNVTNLRVMVEFPSRGAKVTGGGNNLMGNPKGTGQNWSSSSTAPGDFSPFNLNTDIVEQRWQSNGALSATLICDTEVAQGTAVDTLAILEHNLTSSAIVTVEASNDPGFSPVGETIVPTWTKQNIWYIAPTYPTTQYRYWRITISDATNPDTDGLKIGTIVFGITTILQGECFIDEVRRRQRHFVDKVPTEGFTNVSNDRALKSSVGMEFRNIQYNRGNYINLKDIFEFARTSFKCLWIPDPRDPPRFGLFAKIVQIPDETHRNLGAGTAADRVDFSLEIDESL